MIKQNKKTLKTKANRNELKRKKKISIKPKSYSCNVAHQPIQSSPNEISVFFQVLPSSFDFLLSCLLDKHADEARKH